MLIYKVLIEFFQRCPKEVPLGDLRVEGGAPSLTKQISVEKQTPLSET